MRKKKAGSRPRKQAGRTSAESRESKRLILTRGRKQAELRQSHVKKICFSSPEEARKQDSSRVTCTKKGLSMPKEASRQDSGRVMRKKKACPRPKKPAGGTTGKSRERKRLVLARGSKQVGLRKSQTKGNGLSTPEEASRLDFC